jgi:hypothetical protein
MLSDSGAIDKPQHRAVLEHHLEVDRKGDHHAAERDLLEHLVRDPQQEDLGAEQARVDQRGLAVPLAPHEPGGQHRHADHADQQQRGDGPAALLPHQDAEHDAAHAEHRQDRTDRVDVAIARIRGVAHPPDVEQDDRDDHGLEREPHAPREVRGDEAAEQRPHRRGDRRGGADERVGLPLRRSFEVTVDEGLH